MPRYTRAWLPARATGAELGRPYSLALLAEAYGKVGQTEEGLSLLAEALAVVDKTGERFYEAELYRLKGELTLQQVQGSEVQNVVEVRSTKSQVRTSESGVGSRSVFSEGHRDCPQAAGEVAGTAGGDEPRRLWQQQGKTEKKLTRCYPRSTTGSPKGLIRKTCKRRRRC